MWTNVVEPQRWSSREALRLSPWRWQGERWFFDRQAGGHWPRCSTGSPQGVAMQVSAAARMHPALRVAQGHIAHAIGTQPAEIAPAKVFPRRAAAARGLTWSEMACLERHKAHPGIDGHKPDWRRCACAWTTFEHMRLELRNGRRRKRRFCQSRTQWKSFTHSPGGKKLT